MKRQQPSQKRDPKRPASSDSELHSSIKKPNLLLAAYWQTLEVEASESERAQAKLAEQAASTPKRGRLSVLGQDPARPVPENAASRRNFVSLLGASAALAGLTTGCIRKPEEHILPFAKRPEDLIPGEPQHYASAFAVGGSVFGIVVESHDGRPIKVEGNEKHPASWGRTDAWAQASMLNLYDPDRSRHPMSRVSAAYAVAEDEETAREGAAHTLCEHMRKQTLDVSKSVDRAVEAFRRCEEGIEERGEWHVEKDAKGNTVATVLLESDHQAAVDWSTTWQRMREAMADKKSKKGRGLALVTRASMSPTYRGLLTLFKQEYPQAKVVLDDPHYPVNAVAAAEVVGGSGARYFHSLDGARVIVAADCDFLGTEADHVRLAGEFAKGRVVDDPQDSMNRLYAVEPHLTNTGIAADNRLRLRGSEVATFLMLVAVELEKTLGPGSGLRGSEALRAGFPSELEFDAATEHFAIVVAKDLAENVGKAVVMVGERQPAAVHGLGLYINGLLKGFGGGAPGTTRIRVEPDAPAMDDLGALASGLEGEIDTVICLDTNPVYDAPGSLGLAEKLAAVPNLIHCGTHHDETGQVAKWHLPISHFLEAWGDLESSDGTVSIQQPLIAPLHDTPSALEILAALVRPEAGHGGDGAPDGFTQVKGYWDAELGSQGGLSDRRWRQWLHDGIASGIPRPPRAPNFEGWDKLGRELGRLSELGKGFEVNFHIDPKVGAGDYSNNAWMQELPHPASKLTWDNAAYVSTATAEELGVENGDYIAIKLGDRSAAIPCWVIPGQADHTVSVTLGYGREGVGSVAQGAGFDVNKLRNHDSPWFEFGSVSRGAGSYKLVSTQDFGSLDPDGEEGTPIGKNYEARSLYRETTRKGYEKNPDFAKEGDLMPPERLRSLWERPKGEHGETPAGRDIIHTPELTGPHQWGMSIDLNLCTGCNACVIACQAENNIPVVGKTQVGNGREMHWMRIDRYFTGSEDNPQAVYQPIGCQHCETAPCENVCPVQATAHSPEGLNDMAYNRCIGTRYCANNCPYKVRRFNFLYYNKQRLGGAWLNGIHSDDDEYLLWMSVNPDVTVRSRGVIEKCSYCVQRITEAKIQAHVRGEDKVKDGDVITACQQACPTSAIIFGDLTDENSAVSKKKRQRRDYTILADLNTHPRTSFLGRVRNPNPELS